jgi:predicted metal-dependent phosphotriesterase family hydrolase
MALAALAKAGFTQAEIDLMTKENPARFLGLK